MTKKPVFGPVFSKSSKRFWKRTLGSFQDLVPRTHNLFFPDEHQELVIIIEVFSPFGLSYLGFAFKGYLIWLMVGVKVV